MTENEEYLFEHVLTHIKLGFESLEDIIDNALEIADDEELINEVSEEWIRETATKEFAKHQAESKSWQHPTDPDRLRLAFDNLCKNNIIALHEAGYETADAVYDARQVWQDAEDEGLTPIGYCYYHGQDLERVIESDVLMIGYYGATDNNEKEAIIIGNKVVAALKEVGFDPQWNGSAKKRIELHNFNWQNVFTTDDDVEEKWGYDRILQLMRGE